VIIQGGNSKIFNGITSCLSIIVESNSATSTTVTIGISLITSSDPYFAGKF
jgi:hypothetical protein